MKLNAIVLAAGYGSRLAPLTQEVPKPALPVAGVPMLIRILRKLKAAGVDRIAVNTHHRKEQIEECVKRSGVADCVRLFHEPDILGTAGPLVNARELLTDCDYFLLHNSDVICDFPLEPMVREHVASGATVSLAVIDGPENRLHIENGEVVDILNRLGVPCSENAESRTYACIAVYSRDFFEILPEKPEYLSMVDVWIKALKAGRRIHVYHPPEQSFWSDIGSFEQYFDANEKLLKGVVMKESAPESPILLGKNDSIAPDAKLTGFVSIGDRVSIPSGTELHNCIVLDDARVEAGFHAWEILTPHQEIHRDQRKIAALEIMKSLPEGWRLRSLPEQGSDRKFLRIELPDRSTRILMLSNENDKDFERFLELGKFFHRNALFTPCLHAASPDEYAVLMEDLGSDTLYRLVQGREKESFDLYRKVLRALAEFQVRGTKALDADNQAIRVFSRRYLRWETDYFRENFLERLCRLVPDAGTLRELNREFDALAFAAEKLPYLLIHRDFQSQNILLQNGKVRFVDYQGARLAPYPYDAVSLIRDPYVTIPPEMRKALMEEYRKSLAELDYKLEPDEFRYHGILAALQRNMQTLGAYGFLSLVKGKRGYLRYAGPSLALLRSALEQLSELPGEPALPMETFRRLCTAAEPLLKERLKELGELS